MSRRPLSPRFGRRFETRSPEESRQLLTQSNRQAGLSRQLLPPKLSVAQVVDEWTVRFAGDRVPPNFTNLHLPQIRTREAGPSVWSVKQDWREWAVLWGNQARVKARWEKAGFGRLARVEIVFHRVRQLDEDGRFSAATPILNGLKLIVKQEELAPVEGCGLIYDDDPDHLPEGHHQIRQVAASGFSEQQTVVTVTRLD